MRVILDDNFNSPSLYRLLACSRPKITEEVKVRIMLTQDFLELNPKTTYLQLTVPIPMKLSAPKLYVTVNPFISWFDNLKTVVLNGISDVNLSNITLRCSTFICCFSDTLELLPQLPNCIELFCDGNKLIQLPKLPMAETIYCHSNKLTWLPDLPSCKVLYCYNNNIKEILYLPSCRVLDCSNNEDIKIADMPLCHRMAHI